MAALNTKISLSRWSNGKIEDCEQSIIVSNGAFMWRNEHFLGIIRLYKITFHQGAIFNQIYPGFIKGADQLNSKEVGRGCGQEPMGSGMGDFRKNFLQTDFEGKIILQGNTLPWWLFMSGKKFYHQRLQRFGKKNSCPESGPVQTPKLFMSRT